MKREGKREGKEKRDSRETMPLKHLTFHLSQAKPGEDNTLEGGN